MAGEIYCIDASSLIKLKQDFPRAVFPSVWKRASFSDRVRDFNRIVPA
jgi:hypothetical protein